jgi:hypothetical protein
VSPDKQVNRINGHKRLYTLKGKMVKVHRKPAIAVIGDERRLLIIGGSLFIMRLSNNQPEATGLVIKNLQSIFGLGRRGQ